MFHIKQGVLGAYVGGVVKKGRVTKAGMTLRFEPNPWAV